MSDAARNALPDGAPQPGQEVHVTLVPSVVRANRMEPIRFSVFGDGQDHKVTVTRNAAGEFVASASPIDKRIISHRASRRRPAAGLEPLRQPALHRRAAGHPARRHPADPQDPRLRDGLPPAGARRRRLRVLLRRQGGGQGRRRQPRRVARHLRHLGRREPQVLPLPHPRRRRRLLRRAGQHLAQVPDAAPGARRGRAHHLGLRRAPPSDPADPEDAHRRRLGLRDRHADHGGGQRRHRGGRAARANTATTSASATPTATRPPTATCPASPRA